MIQIAATGMVTALGMTSQASGAAIRAGLSAFQEIPFVDGRGYSIIAAPVRNRLHGVLGISLLAHMAFLAIEECLGGALISEVPLLLAVSDQHYSALTEDLELTLLGELATLFDRPLHAKSSLVATGGAACLDAIRQAQTLLSEGRVAGCLVCGVDSLISADVLSKLERSQRLKSADNPDGLIPGEAAACLYLRKVDPQMGQGALLIRGLGFAREEVTIDSDRPVLGIGLANAMKAALEESRLTMEAIDFRISNVTGERYGFIEANFALGRILRVRKETFEFLHLMDSIGAVGAAAGACMLAYWKFLLDRGAVPAWGGFCETASDDGARAVAVVTSGTERYT
jgi:3-oxoacyl-[acyl-carrier-protein] synthase-1